MQGVLGVFHKGISPPTTTPPPSTGPNSIIETISITENQANTYQPEILQDGENIVTAAGNDRCCSCQHIKMPSMLLGTNI